MRHRILFVDDEYQVLQGLRRMLHGQSREWEMHFAPGGREALEMMTATPMDVVVSDMRMPGMDGVQLLSEIKSRYPGAARVALSGQMDQRMIMDSTKVVHQYLSKPCSPETLIAVLRRLLALRTYLSDESLACVTSSLEHIPSLPDIFVAIQDELQSSGCSLENIGKIISSDVGMCAKILQLVNSSFFGMRTKVTNPAQAVNLLGTETIKALVLHVEIFTRYDSRKCPAFSLASLARHSMMTATLSRRISDMEKAPAEAMDAAFLAGLLHDVGKLVFAVNYPDLYDEILEMTASGNLAPTSVEREVLGADHAQLGGYLLGLWGFADTVVEAIAFHHNPALSTTCQSIALNALHAANALVNRLTPEDRVGATEPDMHYLDACGLSERFTVWEGKAETLLGMTA